MEKSTAEKLEIFFRVSFFVFFLIFLALFFEVAGFVFAPTHEGGAPVCAPSVQVLACDNPE